MVNFKPTDPPSAPFDMAPLQELYPWKGHWVERSKGVKLHYLDEGSGPPMVFLHGNPTWSFYWRRLIAEFSKTHRCIAPDHIGMGLSDKPEDADYNYTLDSRVEDVDALLKHLDITEDITLVLHDWGGMIGLGWALPNLHKIKRVILLNTAGFRLPEGRELPWQLKLVKRLPFAIPVRGFNAFVLGAAKRCSTRPGRMTPEIRKGYLLPYDSWKNRISIHRFVEDIPLTPKDPAFATTEMVQQNLHRLADLPVQIFWGEKDFVFDMHFLEEWRRRLPNAEVHTFPDCGHYILEDAPEEIISHMRDFFQRFPDTGESVST